MFTVLNTFFLSPRRFFVSFSVKKKPLLTVGLWFTKREKETGSMTTSSELNWNLLNYLYIVDVDGRTRLSAAQKCHLLHWICVDCARQSQAVPVYAMRSVNTYIRRFFSDFIWHICEIFSNENCFEHKLRVHGEFDRLSIAHIRKCIRRQHVIFISETKMWYFRRNRSIVKCVSEFAFHVKWIRVVDKNRAYCTVAHNLANL